MIDEHVKNKKIILISIIAIVIIIILSIVFILIINKKNKAPKISSDTEEAEFVNESIDYIYKKYENTDSKVSSDKSTSNNIESILITIEKNVKGYNHKIPLYVSYNYDTKTNKLLSFNELAEQFGYEYNDIVKLVNKRFNDWYTDEVEQGYVEENECDFNCYISFYRNIENIEEVFTLYVKNNKLYVYIGFDIDSIIGDKEYFDNLKYNPYIIEL